MICPNCGYDEANLVTDYDTWIEYLYCSECGLLELLR